jgi:cobalt-zinc-cadmium efflux system outer membrane protein
MSARTRAQHVQGVLLPLYTRIVNNTQLQYNAMQVGIFQLLLAKHQQINAGLQYIDTLRDFWLARTELEQALSGSLADIDTVSMAESSEGDRPTLSLSE